MINYTYPAFVRIEDVEKRTEVIEYLEMLGYEKDYVFDISDYRGVLYTVTINNCIRFKASDWDVRTARAYKSYINCHSNIELFKAVVAMNDTNNLHQWFKCKTGQWLNLYTDERSCELDKDWWHKATLEELFEHFGEKL